VCYSVTALYRRYRAVTDFETRVTISIKSVCRTGQSAGGRIAQLKFICSSTSRSLSFSRHQLIAGRTITATVAAGRGKKHKVVLLQPAVRLTQ